MAARLSAFAYGNRAPEYEPTDTRVRELTVDFDRELVAFGDGKDRTVVAQCHTAENGKRHKIRIKGRAAAGDFDYAMSYRIYGRWKKTHKWGWQFEFQSFLQTRPHGKRGVIRYLTKLKNIGQGIASQLWDVYESDAVEILREQPVRAASRIHSLSLAVAQEAAERLKYYEATEAAMIDLLGLLDGRGFPKSLPETILKLYGNSAVDDIKADPYRLLDFKGIGFLLADKMYLDLGHDPAAIERQARCVWHKANSDSSGFTWLDYHKCVSELRDNISSADIKPNEAFECAIGSRLIAVHQDGEGNNWFSETSKANSESTIADYILSTINTPARWPVYQIENDEFLTDHQKREILKAFEGSVCCLGGSPGTGKTYALARAIRAALELSPGYVACCAPTGKAAVRLSETLDGLARATTIHRMLNVIWDEDTGRTTFTFNEQNKLPYKYIFVDESSMIDSQILARMLSACRSDTHIMFVGDINQLPPVGHGSPLRDFIRSGMAAGELTEIKRNAGQIVRTCKAIKESGSLETSKTFNPDAGENLYVYRAFKPAEQIAIVESLIQKAARKGYNPKWDVQVICALNNKSDISRKPVSEALQSALNPDGETAGDNPFRVGDKVICLKNGWGKTLRIKDIKKSEPVLLDICEKYDWDEFTCDRPDELNDEEKAYIANGEIGEAVKVEPNRTYVELQNPGRLILVPRGSEKKKDDENDTGCNWDLAYAISCHKSQGAQWPVVIVLIDSSPSARSVCSREWVYTAASRASDACIFVGKHSTLKNFCLRSELKGRKTFLVERLKGEF